jgi:hypothetical protein
VVQTADELEVFRGGEAVVERSRFRDVPDALLDLERIRADVKARDHRASAGRADHARENLDRR